ncbi:hypothetical protein OAK75_07315 [Bacteriovoracales bacterium]|nr:hypothetical protein [Bacteriovoracales bacterium]
MVLYIIPFLVFFNVFQALATHIPAGSTVGGPQFMGGMYNSEKDYFDPAVTCVEASPQNIKVIFNEVATVNLSSNINFKDIEKELSRGAGVDNFGFSGDFIKKSRETKTSITFAYKTILKAGDEILSSPYRLTQEAYELAERSLKEFKAYCGDQFIYKISKGVRAYVAIKLEVGSIEKKRLIKKEFNLNFVDLINISSTLDKIRKKYEIKGEFKVYGHQEGGFAARINSIFGNGRGMSHCSAPDLKDCQMSLSSVLDYFSNEFPLQFEPYYRDRFGSGAIALPSTSFPLIYSAQSYCKLPTFERPPSLICDREKIDNSDTLKKLNFLTQKNKNQLLKIREIKEKTIERLSPTKEDLLFEMEVEVKSNLTKLNNAFVLCERDPWSCKGLVHKMEQGLNTIHPRALLDIQKEDRIEICLESGAQNKIGGVEFKFIKSTSLTSPFQSYTVSDLKPNGCFTLRDPSFDVLFKGLKVSVIPNSILENVDSEETKSFTQVIFGISRNSQSIIL